MAWTRDHLRNYLFACLLACLPLFVCVCLSAISGNKRTPESPPLNSTLDGTGGVSQLTKYRAESEDVVLWCRALAKSKFFHLVKNIFYFPLLVLKGI